VAKPKPDGERGKTPSKESRKGRGGMARFCAGLVLVALLLYVTSGVAMRFASVRGAMCEEISRRLGVKVDAGSSQFGLPFAMVLRNVTTEGYESGDGGFVFQKLRISPGGGRRWHVSCDCGTLRLVCNRDGTWEPSGFAALGPVPESDLSQVSRFTAVFCSRATLDVSGMSVRWMRLDNEVATADGVSLVVRPTELSGRVMLHHELVATNVVGVGGASAANVRRDWLAGEGMSYRELVHEGGEVTGKGVFWEGPKQ
jgi:hypothetical protein